MCGWEELGGSSSAAARQVLSCLPSGLACGLRERPTRHCDPSLRAPPFHPSRPLPLPPFPRSAPLHTFSATCTPPHPHTPSHLAPHPPHPAPLPSGVDILSSGDTVGELFLLLGGTAEVISPDPSATAQQAAQVAPQGDSLAQGVPDYRSDGEVAADMLEPRHPFWSSGAGPASAADIRLNPNSPISTDVSGVRRPVAEGSVLVRGGPLAAPPWAMLRRRRLCRACCRRQACLVAGSAWAGLGSNAWLDPTALRATSGSFPIRVQGEAAFFTEVAQLEAVRSLTGERRGACHACPMPVLRPLACIWVA